MMLKRCCRSRGVSISNCIGVCEVGGVEWGISYLHYLASSVLMIQWLPNISTMLVTGNRSIMAIRRPCHEIVTSPANACRYCKYTSPLWLLNLSNNSPWRPSFVNHMIVGASPSQLCKCWHDTLIIQLVWPSVSRQKIIHGNEISNECTYIELRQNVGCGRCTF